MRRQSKNRKLSQRERREFYEKARNHSAILTYYLYRRISCPISERLYRTRLVPNQVTFMGLIFAIIAALLVSVGKYPHLLIAGIFIQLAHIADLVDGELARLKGAQSTFGKWLDSNLGLLNSLFIYFGCAVGYFSQTSDWKAFLFLSLVLSTRFYLNYSIFTTARDFNVKGEEAFGPLIWKVSQIIGIRPRHITYSDDLKQALMTLGIVTNQLLSLMLVLIATHLIFIVMSFIGVVRLSSRQSVN